MYCVGACNAAFATDEFAMSTLDPCRWRKTIVRGFTRRCRQKLSDQGVSEPWSGAGQVATHHDDRSTLTCVPTADATTHCRRVVGVISDVVSYRLSFPDRKITRTVRQKKLDFAQQKARPSRAMPAGLPTTYPSRVLSSSSRCMYTDSHHVSIWRNIDLLHL